MLEPDLDHEQIRSTNRIIADNRRELSTLVSEDSLARFSQFLKSRTKSVQNHITASHQKKLQNLRQKFRPGNTTDSLTFAIRPLSTDERAILEKGPKFALPPSLIPHKNIVAEIEARRGSRPWRTWLEPRSDFFHLKIFRVDLFSIIILLD